MKIYIKYYRQQGFGNQATLQIDIDPEFLVVDLKRMIFARIGMEVRFQQLQTTFHGKLETMNDECSLSFYNIKENDRVQLENIQQEATESEVRFFLDAAANQGDRQAAPASSEPQVHAAPGHPADEAEHQQHLHERAAARLEQEHARS